MKVFHKNASANPPKPEELLKVDDFTKSVSQSCGGWEESL